MAEENEGELPGVEGPGVGPMPKIKAIESAANEYDKAKQARCDAMPNELASKRKLIDVLHKNADKLPRTPEGAMIYKRGDIYIELRPGKEKLKVSLDGEDNDNDGSDDE